MIRKTYEVKGMMEWHPVFTIGRTRIQVPFTGGHMSDGAVTAASFTTADRVVQTVIERSEAFKTGRIRLGHQYEVCQADARVPHSSTPVADASSTEMAVLEYGSVGEAADFLQFMKGVPLEKLKDKKSCVKEARKLGIDLKIAE